jgi:hypothetical protein
MNTIESQIKIVNDKLQQLLKKNILLKKDNDTLTNQLVSLKEKELDYKTTIDSLSQKVNILQAASGHIDEKNKKELEKRINQYVKDIDKFIGMLSE